MNPENYPHGTASRYNNLKCRCDLCRKAKSEYNAKFRAGLCTRREAKQAAPVVKDRRCANLACEKKLNRYNPGPLCNACRYERVPPQIKDIYDLVAERERIAYGG